MKSFTEGFVLSQTWPRIPSWKRYWEHTGEGGWHIGASIAVVDENSGAKNGQPAAFGDATPALLVFWSTLLYVIVRNTCELQCLVHLLYVTYHPIDGCEGQRPQLGIDHDVIRANEEGHELAYGDDIVDSDEGDITA